MNFFKDLLATGIKNVTIEVKTAEDGRITVLTCPKSIAEDSSLKSMKPLLLTGTVDELDDGYFEAITSPLQKTSEFFNNVESYEATMNAAKKETSEAKAGKDKEKTLQTELTTLTAKLKTPADWLKNKEKITDSINAILELNPENASAKKAKKDLDVNVAKAGIGDGLFADVPNAESVEEIPTEEVEEPEEEEESEEEEETEEE